MHIVHVIEVGVPLIAVGAFAYTRTKHSAQHQGARQATRRLGIGAGFAIAPFWPFSSAAVSDGPR